MVANVHLKDLLKTNQFRNDITLIKSLTGENYFSIVVEGLPSQATCHCWAPSAA